MIIIMHVEDSGCLYLAEKGKTRQKYLFRMSKNWMLKFGWYFSFSATYQPKVDVDDRVQLALPTTRVHYLRKADSEFSSTASHFKPSINFAKHSFSVTASCDGNFQSPNGRKYAMNSEAMQAWQEFYKSLNDNLEAVLKRDANPKKDIKEMTRFLKEEAKVVNDVFKRIIHDPTVSV